MPEPSTITGIPRERIGDVWPKVLPLIEIGLAEGWGAFGPEDVRRALDDGRNQLWAAVAPDGITGVLVTAVEQYPRRAVLAIVLVAGRDMDELLGTVMVTLDAFARANNCSAVLAHGRRGWVRAAGFKEIGAVMLRELEA
jgi:hypothetical protein